MSSKQASGSQPNDLLALRLPQDAGAIALLPHPRESAIGELSADQLAEVVVHFREQLVHLGSEEAWEPGGTAEEIQKATGDSEGFWTVLRVVGIYCGFALFRYAEKGEPAPAADLVKGRLARYEPPTEGDSKIARQAIYRVLFCFERCARSLFHAATADRVGFLPGELSERFDSDLSAITALETIHGPATETGGELLALYQSLLSLALEYRAAVLRRRREKVHSALQSSPWAVSQRELTLLSVRAEVMARKYGEKRIERMFEQQLELVFQSFGFTVIPTRPGEVGADLICVARRERFSFLVDAKTSAGSYKFPKSDQRAIEDYGEEFASRLSDLPPLAFILIVGRKAEERLAQKLEAAEAKAGVPLRFLEAGTVARLRQALPGPLLAGPFRDAVLRSKPIVDQSILESSKEALKGIDSAYLAFVDGLKGSSA